METPSHPWPPPGVHCIEGPDGRNWPVIDITHPGFALSPADEEMRALTETYVRDEERRARMPRWLGRLFFPIVLRKSQLAQSLRRAEGGFLDGLSTYRLKLGPNNLPPPVHPIDRRIAASLPCVSMRLRLQDMAAFLAGELAPRLAANPKRALHLVNIAGGPATDSINTLLLLHARDAGLLARPVRIHVFDQDEAGPAFGARALDALRAPGAALESVDAVLTHVPYRWDLPDTFPAKLRSIAPADAVLAASSEGGLFDYGSDDEILSNLRALREVLPPPAFMAGTVSRADRPAAHVQASLRFTTRLRRLEAFTALARAAGWKLERSIARPFNFSVALRSLR